MDRSEGLQIESMIYSKLREAEREEEMMGQRFSQREIRDELKKVLKGSD